MWWYIYVCSKSEILLVFWKYEIWLGIDGAWIQWMKLWERNWIRSNRDIDADLFLESLKCDAIYYTYTNTNEKESTMRIGQIPKDPETPTSALAQFLFSLLCRLRINQFYNWGSFLVEFDSFFTFLFGQSSIIPMGLFIVLHRSHYVPLILYTP